MNINKVILVGRVGQTPKIKDFDNGGKVASINLATTNVYKNKQGEKVEQTDWHTIVVWGAQASIVEKYVVKGSELGIEGRLQNRTYEKSSECKMKITEVFCEKLQLGAKPKSEPKSQQATKEGNEDFPDITDDLPF